MVRSDPIYTMLKDCDPVVQQTYRQPFEHDKI